MCPAVDAPAAVVLVSGGLDSSTCLAIAREQGYRCYGLTVDYGQRHDAEIAAAGRIAEHLGVQAHRCVQIDLRQFGGSALTDETIEVPEAGGEGIPVTYVPARNTVMLSLALAWAEVLEAQSIFIGVNAVDYSGYPDCRPAFVEAFERLANLATRVGVEEGGLRVHAPLIEWSKARIVRAGTALGVEPGPVADKDIACHALGGEGLVHQRAQFIETLLESHRIAGLHQLDQRALQAVDNGLGPVGRGLGRKRRGEAQQREQHCQWAQHVHDDLLGNHGCVTSTDRSENGSIAPDRVDAPV